MEQKSLETLYEEMEIYRDSYDELKLIETQARILDAIGVTSSTMLSLEFCDFIYSSEAAAKELKALMASEFQRGYKKGLEEK